MERIELLSQREVKIQTLRDELEYTAGEVASILAKMFCHGKFDFWKTWQGERQQSVIEKLKCLMLYFYSVQVDDNRKIKYIKRRFQPQKLEERVKYWAGNQTVIGHVEVDLYGKIEDSDGYTLSDFANKYIGGGFLQKGCVQEEILFATHPELIALMVLHQDRVQDFECLSVEGVCRYTDYEGYASSFKCKGLSEDTKLKSVVCFDALMFKYSGQDQRDLSFLIRELDKAQLALQGKVATGNWGCGAFGGDVQLKAKIQVMAAASNGCHLKYCTFGDPKLSVDFFHRLEGCTIAEVFDAL